MKKRIIISSAILLLFILSLIGIYLYKIKTRNAVEKFIGKDLMINILIVGSNIYNENMHKFYAVLSIQPKTKKVGLLFIPPNFKVTLDEMRRSYCRIDQVDINDFTKLSSSLYRDLKLKIPFYMVLYSPDVERLVDLLGGLDLYVLDQVKDIYGIKYGVNYFDGVKASQYINSAEENSIFLKYDRIQDILLTVFSDRKDYMLYNNIEFLSEVIRTLKTNLMAQEIVTIADLLNDDKSDFICTTLPGTFSGNGYFYIDNVSKKIYEDEFLKRLFREDNSESPVKIKILNGTEVIGLAKKTRAFLVRRGIHVIEFGTSPFPLQENTVIINQKAEIGPAKKVADLLSIDKIYHIIDSTQLNNVLLIIGRDFKQWKKNK